MPRKPLLKDLFFTILPMLLVVGIAHFGGESASAGDAVGHYADDRAPTEDAAPAPDDHYANDVSDLPVFEGFAMKDDMNTVFDSPEGRIIDVVMEGDPARKTDAMTFYENTLPQLGWKKVSGKGEGMVFERGEEELTLSPETENHALLLKFSIRPMER
jgi:hypothetical protein